MSHWYRREPLVRGRAFAALMLALLVACTLCVIWAGAPAT